MIKKLWSNQLLKDGTLSIGAKGIFFGILQLCIYPLLSRSMGKAVFGEILTQLAFVNIFSYSYGESLCNIRVLNQNEDQERTAEYRQLAGISFIGIIIVLAGYSIFIVKSGIFRGLMLGLIGALMMLRLYSDSIFKIDINFKKILLSSIFTSFGYILGYILYSKGMPWYVVFILGESVAVLYAGIAGKAFKIYRKAGSTYSAIRKNYASLSASYLLSYALTNLDRILIGFLINSEAVSVYYAASLYGKTVALVVPPVSTVLLSYFSKDTIVITKKIFRNIVLASLGGILFFFLAGIPVSRVLVYILYPDFYQETLRIIDICNLSQIIYYGCSMINMMAFRICNINFQMKVEVVYAIVFLVLVISGSKTFGLMGLALGMVIANLIRFMIFTVLVYKNIRTR